MTFGIQRTSLVLRLIASQQRNGIGLTKLAKTLSLEVPTAHRVLKELETVRMVQRDTKKKYRLGSLLLELGATAMHSSPLIDGFRPVLTSLASRTGDTVFLIVRSGDESVCLDRAEGSFPIKTLIMEKGGRRPLGVGGASMHLLSQLGQEEAFEIIDGNAYRYTEFHDVNVEALKLGYLQAQRNGYGINRNSQTSGVTAVGVALPQGVAGGTQLGIGVACITPRMTESHLDFVIDEIKRAINTVACDAETLSAYLTNFSTPPGDLQPSQGTRARGL
jgi:DNA-binding IclR family transcriptional regulator